MKELVDLAFSLGGSGVSFSQQDAVGAGWTGAARLAVRNGGSRAVCQRWMRDRAGLAGGAGAVGRGRKGGYDRFGNRRIIPAAEEAAERTLEAAAPDPRPATRVDRPERFGQLLALLATPLSGGERVYRLLTVEGAGVAATHAVVAEVGEEVITLFDPESGEYRLPREGFARWLPSYWVLTGNEAKRPPCLLEHFVY